MRAWERVTGAWIAAMAALAGCSRGGQPPPPAGPPTWRAEKAGEAHGFQVPECALVDPDPVRDAVYVSNMATTGTAYWGEDYNGFISLLDAEGVLNKRKWLPATPNAALSEPKGMCVAEGVLYVADNTRVMTFNLTDGSTRRIDIPGAQLVNDLAAYQGFAYASDTGAGVIYKLSAPVRTLKAPPSVNGITFDAQGRMFAVSWDLHDLYEVDPEGRADPKPFGLARNFVHLDGIEVMPDGTFIVSDFDGNRVWAVTPDRKTAYILARPTTPADIGLDRTRRLLYVPSFQDNRLLIYKLKRN